MTSIHAEKYREMAAWQYLICSLVRVQAVSVCMTIVTTDMSPEVWVYMDNNTCHNKFTFYRHDE